MDSRPPRDAEVRAVLRDGIVRCVAILVRRIGAGLAIVPAPNFPQKCCSTVPGSVTGIPSASFSTPHPPVGAFTGSGSSLPRTTPFASRVTSSGRKFASFFHSAFSSTHSRQSSSGISVPFSGHSAACWCAFAAFCAAANLTCAARVAAAAVSRNARRVNLVRFMIFLLPLAFVSLSELPQRLKPKYDCSVYGTAEAVPFR